jgi:glycosyltransferase involved in cell wall biosynthesis
MEQKMGRVLHLTLAYGTGGRSKAIRTLLEGLYDLGVECDLCGLEQLSDSAADMGRLVGAADLLNRRSLVDWKALRRLNAFCQERRIRIIHAHDAASQFTAALLRLRHPGVQMLMTFHRSLGFESARFRDRVRNAFTGLQSAAIVTGSWERRQHYLRENLVSPKKVVRIPFGVDTRRFRPDPEARAAVRRELGLGPDAVVLGAIGHFGQEKGLDVVLRGFAAVAARRRANAAPLDGAPPVALVVAGDGPPERRELLRALARECQPARVLFAGFRSDVPRLLQAFDLFVHAPRLEAFGLVLIEAMASGLPVVATRVGGIPEIVRDGDNGILVPGDAPGELAAAAERLLASDDLRRGMAERSRQLAESEFRVDLYARRHLRLYRDLLAGRPPGIADARAEGGGGRPPARSLYNDRPERTRPLGGIAPCQNK